MQYRPVQKRSAALRSAPSALIPVAWCCKVGCAPSQKSLNINIYTLGYVALNRVTQWGTRSKRRAVVGLHGM